MKKGILLFFLLSTGLIADDTMVSELKSLNSEYETLVQEEEMRFQKEKSLSEAAAAQNIELEKLKLDIEVHFPKMEYCTDNAAMIGVAAYYELKNKKIDDKKNNYDVDAISTKEEK